MKKKLRGKVYETRATLLRRFSEPVEPPPYWKMKRWTDVSKLAIIQPLQSPIDSKPMLDMHSVGKW